MKVPNSENINFHITVNTSAGPLTIPTSLSDGITLNGRQSKVIVTDYSFGNSNKLLYSTANILFAGVIGEQDVVFLYSDLNEGSEFAFGSFTVDIPANSFSPGVQALFTHQNSTSPLILFADTETAGSFWAPVIPSTGDFGSFWQFGSNETVLVGGPYLVRNATISSAGELALRGDLNASTPLTLVLPPSVSSVSWNGEAVDIAAVTNVPGMFTGQLELKSSPSDIKIPVLTNWKFKDSLPEVQASFDDSLWITADHTTTNITKPLFGDGRVLYGKRSTRSTLLPADLTFYRLRLRIVRTMYCELHQQLNHLFIQLREHHSLAWSFPRQCRNHFCQSHHQRWIRSDPLFMFTALRHVHRYTL